MVYVVIFILEVGGSQFEAPSWFIKFLKGLFAAALVFGARFTENFREGCEQLLAWLGLLTGFVNFGLELGVWWLVLEGVKVVCLTLVVLTQSQLGADFQLGAAGENLLCGLGAVGIMSWNLTGLA